MRWPWWCWVDRETNVKVLYGVQGTGNGHISRALAMQRAFAAFPELEITWLLSSRPPGQGMGQLLQCEWRNGLSFVAREGRVDPIATLRQAKLRRFWRDVKELDCSGYDLVLTDFEPVVAHAARKRGIPVTGLGHQYVFQYRVPRRGSNPIVDCLMQRYAPATRALGLHWHHFGQSGILPPILDLAQPEVPVTVQPNKIIVYLAFESPPFLEALLRQFTAYEFYVYHPLVQDEDQGHVHWRAISRDGFKRDLASAVGVLTNSGFELISECLQWNKKILTKPLHGQMEQSSNAAALEQLGYATVVDELQPQALREWLEQGKRPPYVRYPDVATAVARWLVEGQRESVASLAARLWQETRVDAERRSDAA